jgi:hypothetical protein
MPQVCCPVPIFCEQNCAGNLFELVVLELPDTVIVIHAMALRRSTRHELFGDESS